MLFSYYKLLQVAFDSFLGSGILPKKGATSAFISISSLMGKRQCEESSKGAGRSSAGNRFGWKRTMKIENRRDIFPKPITFLRVSV
jgi:hypothetical protein